MAVNFKKLNYTLTAYFNTGFNGFDIPASGAVLDSVGVVKKVYNDTYYLREDIDLPSISINDNYHELVDVDYVKLVSNDNPSTVFYYFASPRSAAGNTTILDLELDALTTMGGAPNLNYISGWQVRGHVSKLEDVLFSNVASEDWVPSQPLKTTNYTQITDGSSPSAGTHPSDDLQIIISNIALDVLGKRTDLTYNNIVDIIAGGSYDKETGTINEADIYIPKLEMTPYSTIFNMKTMGQNGNVEVQSVSIPNTCAYDATNPVIKKGIEILYSCGQLQLQGSYTVPKDLILWHGTAPGGGETHYTEATEDGRYIVISGYTFLYEANDFPFEYQYQDYLPKNKKVYSMYRSISLQNMASGGIITKPIYELSYTDHSQAGDPLYQHPVISVWSDPVSTGKPVAKFMSDVASPVVFADTVSGSQWLNSQLVMEGASGSLWNSLNNSFNQQVIDKEGQLATILQLKGDDISSRNRDLAQMRYDNYGFSLGAKIVGAASLAGLSLVGGTGVSVGGQVVSGAASGFAKKAMQGAGGLAGSIGSPLSISLNEATMQANIDNIKDMMAMNAQSYEKNKDLSVQRANELELGMIKNNNIVAPTSMFVPQPNLAMYGYNNFIIYETKLQKDDLISLDQYFQRFGYNGLHKPLTANSFNCREYYCFVQAFDINLKSGTGYGMRVRNKAISQLNNGVRVWKVLPDAQYYELN